MNKGNEQKNGKLRSEIAADERKEKSFFFGLWLINASTTWVFGRTYLPALFVDLLAPLRLGAYGQQVASEILGGVCAVMVLDYAYKKWDNQILVSKTSEQIYYATIGKWTGFVFSLVFTFIVLITTAFKELVNDELIATLDTVAALSFIGVVATHIICMAMYKDHNMDKRDYVSKIKVDANEKGGLHSLIERVSRGALTYAENNSTQLEDDMTLALGKQYQSVMFSRFSDMVENVPVIIDSLPTHVTSDEKTVGTQENEPRPIGFQVPTTEADMKSFLNKNPEFAESFADFLANQNQEK